MLRPSRPMMRPFMSSEGSWTTDTVVSAAWPAASRCITTLRIERTRRSASRLVSSSTWRTRRAESWRASSSTCLSRTCLACDALRLATRSSSRTCSRLRWASRSRSFSSSRARSSSTCSRRPSSLSFASSDSSLERLRSSMRAISARRSRSSASIASRSAGAGDVGASGGRPTPPLLATGAVWAERRMSSAAATSPTARSAAAMTIGIYWSSPRRPGRPGPVSMSVVVRPGAVRGARYERRWRPCGAPLQAAARSVCASIASLAVASCDESVGPST